MLNVSSGIGRCCSGFFADRIGPTNAMFGVVLMSGLTQLLVWNFVSDYPGIVSIFKLGTGLYLGSDGRTDGHVRASIRFFRGLLLVFGDACRSRPSLSIPADPSLE
jgi:hypothetical protein